MSILENIDAVHIRPKSENGQDDPSNGLVLCTTHRKAFDALEFAIHPETLLLMCLRRVDDSEFTKTMFNRLPHPLDAESLAWRWERFVANSESE